jgi:hypothetical protein
LALTSPTSGGRSVGIVRSRTKAREFSLVLVFICHYNENQSLQDGRRANHQNVVGVYQIGLYLRQCTMSNVTLSQIFRDSIKILVLVIVREIFRMRMLACCNGKTGPWTLRSGFFQFIFEPVVIFTNLSVGVVYNAALCLHPPTLNKTCPGTSNSRPVHNCLIPAVVLRNVRIFASTCYVIYNYNFKNKENQ